VITERDMTREQMVRTSKDHFCGKCGGPVGIAWSGDLNCYVLRCQDLTHSTITRHQLKDGYQLEREEIWRRVNKVDSTALTKMTQAQMIKRIDGGPKFPQDLTPPQKQMLAEIAITYGFDPMMGEITIYQGRPWVSIDGRYRKAQESKELAGVESRPATKDERLAWGIPDEDYYIRSEVYRKGSDRPFVGWGRVRKTETTVAANKEAFLPVQKDPMRMAEKRGEAQALRKGFSIPLPPNTLNMEDMGSPDVETVVVNSKTGEIIEGTARTVVEVVNPPTTPITKPDQGKWYINKEQLKGALVVLNWAEGCLEWMGLTFHVNVKGKKVSEVVPLLTEDQQKQLWQEVDLRLKQR
jgi:hypothetical protein